MVKRHKKYSHIVESAKELFWKHGIKRVSVEEICRHSSVSKMTFYKYFKNKEDLACTVMRLITEESVEEYKTIMKSTISYKEKLEKIVSLKVSGAKDVSYEVLKDIYSNDFPALNKLVQEESKKNIELVVDDLKKAQKAGNIRNNINIDFILYLLKRSSLLIDDAELNELFETPQKLVEAVVEMFMYGILSREQN